MRRIRGKRVLITGGASGIGRALGERFARHGAALHLLDIDHAALERTVRQHRRRGVQCTATVCDLAHLEEIDRVVEELHSEYRPVDILINNAGLTYYGPTLRMTEAQWERLLAVNFLAPVRLTRRLLPTLLTRPEPHVLNISSLYGFLVTPRSIAYHASKYGLIGFSDALRAEYSRYGLGVTTLCPGFVRTPIYDSAMRPPNEGTIPRPPRWVTITPRRVAETAVRAIRRNRRLATVGWLAGIAYHVTRLFPGFLDAVYRLQRRREIRGRRTKAAECPPLRLYQEPPLPEQTESIPQAA